MAGKMWQKKFAGPQGQGPDPVTPYSNYRSPGHTGWWTPERIDKLIYIMNTYNSVPKAAHALGLRGANVKYIFITLNRLRYGDDKDERLINHHTDPTIIDKIRNNHRAALDNGFDMTKTSAELFAQDLIDYAADMAEYTQQEIVDALVKLKIFLPKEE